MEPTLTETAVGRRGWWLPVALAAALALVGYGFWSRHLWRQEIWQAPGGERFLIFLGAAGLWFGAWILWRPTWLAPATFCLAIAYSTAEVGVLPVLPVAFLLFACYALGRLLLTALTGAAPAFLALLAGLAVYLWLGGVLAHFPVNYPAVWLALLAAPLIVRPRPTAACLRESLALLRPVPLDSRLEYAALALALVPLLAQWLVVLKPEVSADALSMHLVVPAYMADHRLWSFDFHQFTWAVMPMGAIWGYAIAYLLGGEFAARLLNFALLTALCGFLYTAARRWTARPMAFLLAALFAATPVVQLVTGSLFVETFYAALLTGALAALWRHRETGQPCWLAVSAFLLGSSMAVKLLALPFVVAIGAVLLWELADAWRRGRAQGALRWVLISAAIFLVTAPVPYVYAWSATGNPVFPFENQLFRSPYYAPVASPDARFSEPLTWRTPFDLTFETHRYWEGQDGSIGFLLLLAPLLLPWRWREWKFAEWSLLAAAAGGALLGLLLKPNVRYLYPAFPLLTLALAPALRSGTARRWAAAPALLCLGLNLWFLPSSSFYHKTFCLDPFEPHAAEHYLASAAPVRLLVDRLNRAHPGENALFLETGDIAQFRARPYTNGWHSYLFMQRVMALRTPYEALELARGLGIRHFIYPDPATGVPVRESLWKDLIERCSAPEMEVGSFRLASLRPCSIAPAEVPPPGRYDDLDPRISYIANWSHDTQFPQTANRSVTYSDVPGAAFRLTFHGAAITWVYTRAANRGIAEVLLDGQPQGEVDLYAPATAWQSSSVFRAAAAGDHTFEVRVLNRRNPRSSGNYVDVDELVVQ